MTPTTDTSNNDKSAIAPAHEPWLYKAAFTIRDTSIGATQMATNAASFITESVRGASFSLLKSSQALLKASGELSTAIAGETFERLLLGAAALNRGGEKLAQSSLDVLAGNPPSQQSLSERGLRLAIGVLPIIGSTQDYADARKRYNSALLLSDELAREQELHRSRRDCLITCAALSLEIITIGASGKVSTFAKMGKALFSSLHWTKLVREKTADSDIIPTINFDLLSARADRALEFEPVKAAMDYLLKAN